MAGALVRYSKELHKAADVIRRAKAIVIASGAGMGKDSGLPDFRGSDGFWNAYPPLKKRGIELASMSTPRWFDNDPVFAWGFFGHRYNLYKSANPHTGFQILKEWGESKDLGYFVITSNVDGHFQKSGIPAENIVEVHGSINHLQCIDPEHSSALWQLTDDYKFEIDEENLHCLSPLPMGPPGKDTCLARPNILMFGDWYWISERTDAQEKDFYEFQQKIKQAEGGSCAVIEIGAGLAVPTVRMTTEALIGQRKECTLIRINTNEHHVASGHVSLPLGALDALQAINDLLVKGY